MQAGLGGCEHACRQLKERLHQHIWQGLIRVEPWQSAQRCLTLMQSACAVPSKARLVQGPCTSVSSGSGFLSLLWSMAQTCIPFGVLASCVPLCRQGVSFLSCPAAGLFREVQAKTGLHVPAGTLGCLSHLDLLQAIALGCSVGYWMLSDDC